MENSFKKQIILTLIDKLVIATIILVVGYFLNRGIKYLDQQNAKELANINAAFETENTKLQQRLILIKDSLEQEYRQKADIQNKDYQILFESIKSKNSLNDYFIKSSVEKVAEAWGEINQVVFFAQLFQNGIQQYKQELATLNDSVLNTTLITRFEKDKTNAFFESLSVTENGIVLNRKNTLTINTNYSITGLEWTLPSIVKENNTIYVHSYYSKSPRILIKNDSTMSVSLVSNQISNNISDSIDSPIKNLVSYVKLAPMWQTRKRLDEKRVLELLIPINNYYKVVYYNYFGFDYSLASKRIAKARETINSNLFWIGLEHYKAMNNFLDQYENTINVIPFITKKEKIISSLSNLDKLKLDIFNLRESLFKTLSK